ncbi:hypothetical protein HOB87_06855 [Candidatus Woesearchaeota archaeon]|jgi:hypothetical protein|nr:hypothetical protein [Candidatus Woesearchaeota archaeon]MBT3438447.1 hypothetical protein [Candidatus Woesearchaeota archaeon]MBT4058087.1 hypothetical protein [Candidatus Woesearchaeota archaeon]MBT4731670.1 hypothetical protein [Candidatus Woesearchaeota archaeon]MBT5111645.1 hypothetical protein [Candidatus Woesearchaeota archaeon]
MFIRVKSRINSKGEIKKYAYLVRSVRRKRSKKHPKQKVVAYLGRVIELNNNLQQSTTPNLKTLRANLKPMFKELVVSNGFKETSKDSFLRGNIYINTQRSVVKDVKTGQNICLKVNEGYISSYSISKLMNYRPIESVEKEVGRDFAKKLVSSGLKPSQEVFMALYLLISKKFHRK